MEKNFEYTEKEKLFFYIMAAVGFFTLNLAFFYGLLFDRNTILATIKNPISAAFILEAFIMMFALAYLLKRWGVSKIGGRWFVLLSLIGSMAFALPVVLLWRGAPKHVNKN